MEIFKGNNITIFNSSGQQQQQQAPNKAYSLNAETLTECSYLNVVATLIVLERARKLDNPNCGPWVFRSDLHPKLREMCGRYSSYEVLVDSLINSGVLGVAAADNLEKVQEITSEWKNFRLDVEGFRQAMQGSNDMFACVNLKVREGWGALESSGLAVVSQSLLKFNVPPSETSPAATAPAPAPAPESSMFGSLIESIMGRDTPTEDTPPIDTRQPVRLYQDQWGGRVAVYRLKTSFGEVEVEYTNLNSFPGEQPDPETIFESHSKREKYTPLKTLEDGRPVLGFALLPFKKVVTTEGMRPAIGSSQDGRKITGTQSSGSLQVNRETGINLEVQSVAVQSYRCAGMEPNLDGYLKFYQEEGGRKTWNNLVIVWVNGQPIQYVVTTEADQDM